MSLRLSSKLPLVAFDEQQIVIAWNEAAETLTGIPSSDAIGKPCWQMLSGRDDIGAMVCHQGCAPGRLAREGWPVPTQQLHIRCGAERRRVAVETVAVSGIERPFCLHVLNDAPLPDADSPAGGAAPTALGPAPSLTPRQLDVLGLLAEGTRARAIAARLGLAEATVRNHIHAIFVELGAHSQTQAIYLARHHGLL